MRLPPALVLVPQSSVARVNGETVVQLEKHPGPGAGRIGASAPVDVDGNADGAILSTNVASGFVGAMIGLYAYSPSH